MKFQKRYVIAAIILAVLAILLLYSVGIYYLCLYSKLNLCLEHDGPIYSFRRGEMEVLEANELEMLYHDAAGFRVSVQDGSIAYSADDNLGYAKFYENGILRSIAFDNPLSEAVDLITPFSVDSYIMVTLRTEEEISAIKEGLETDGIAYLEEHHYDYSHFGEGYLVVY